MEPKGLHRNQIKILDFLLAQPDGAFLPDLSQHLQVTKSAAKEHIVKLIHMGLIDFKDIQGQVGRPRRQYFLSKNGIEFFPKQYSWMSNILLDQLAENLGSKAVSDIMRTLGKKVASSFSDEFISSQNTPELLVKISKKLNELGYRMNVKQSDVRKGAVLEAYNCVYHSVAVKRPELCNFDIQFIETATNGMSVRLESCIAKGGNSCRFCITKNG